jgi:hypothetical protein
MRRILLLVVVLTTMGTIAQAQDLPKWEFAPTYTILWADIDVLDNETVHGYGLSLQFNVNNYLGLVAEWTATHGASGPVTVIQPGGTPLVIPEMDTRFYTFLGGPRVTMRRNRVNVFGHFLVGMGNSKVEDEVSGFRTGNGEFAMGIGGGLDIYVGGPLSIRAAQFDYVPIHTDIGTRLSGGGGTGSVSDTSTGWQHNTRLQIGVVFRFGQR